MSSKKLIILRPPIDNPVYKLGPDLPHTPTTLSAERENDFFDNSSNETQVIFF